MRRSCCRDYDEDVPEGKRGLIFPDSDEIIMLHDLSGIEPVFKSLVRGLQAKALCFSLPGF